MFTLSAQEVPGEPMHPARPIITAPCSCRFATPKLKPETYALGLTHHEYEPAQLPGTYIEETTIDENLLYEQGLLLRSQNVAKTIQNASPVNPGLNDTMPLNQVSRHDSNLLRVAAAGNSTTKMNNTKLLVDRYVPDLPVRKIKKVLKKSSEHKLRELISYKAEILNSIKVLVPKYKKDQSINTLEVSPWEMSFGPSNLCTSCMIRLRTYLFFSPAPRSPYLYEHSVASYLALIDDANISLRDDVPMESITHDELGSILQAELSVVEWRLSLKLARFHKKTGYLGVFPMEVGEYTDLEIKRALNKPDDGILAIIWSKLKGTTS